MTSHHEDGQRFLTNERVAHIGRCLAPLLRDDLSWIERRKESVEILDDTALRRRVTVDFSLRSGAAKPVLDAQDGDEGKHLYCAPVFVLPKTEGELMDFDLEDEEGRSLWLISRADSARIAAAALVAMAEVSLANGGVLLPGALANELKAVANPAEKEEAAAATGELLAERLLLGRLDSAPWPAELRTLRSDRRFSWWLSCFGHSSVVLVLFRSQRPRRKMAKLSFQEPIRAEPRLLTRLGLAPYEVWVDSPLIEARSYHFEAEAPPGLRVIEARFSDDEQAGIEPGESLASRLRPEEKHERNCIEDAGFLRRVHLYRPGAESAGAGTAVLSLMVVGAGFLGGAAVAAFLTAVALIACHLQAENIAESASAAPALLLAVPGLIASYVGRPGQHALTTRLLSVAHFLVILVAFCAYVGAARLALGGRVPKGEKALAARTDALELWFLVLGVLAGCAFLALVVPWLLKLWRIRPTTALPVVEPRLVPMDPEALAKHLKVGAAPALVPAECRVERHDREEAHKLVSQAISLFGAKEISIEIREAGGDSRLSVSVALAFVVPVPLAERWALNREWRRLERGLDDLVNWARTTPSADGAPSAEGTGDAR